MQNHTTHVLHRRVETYFCVQLHVDIVCRHDGGVTGYIRVVVFSQNAADDFQQALQELIAQVGVTANCKHIVVGLGLISPWCLYCLNVQYVLVADKL